MRVLVEKVDATQKGVATQKRSPKTEFFLKKINLLINAYPHAKFHQIWIINEGVSGKSGCYTKGGRYPKAVLESSVMAERLRLRSDHTTFFNLCIFTAVLGKLKTLQDTPVWSHRGKNIRDCVNFSEQSSAITV